MGAIERLTRGDIRRMEVHRRKRQVPWVDQIAKREMLRHYDVAGSRELIRMRIVSVDGKELVEAQRTESNMSICTPQSSSSPDRCAAKRHTKHLKTMNTFQAQQIEAVQSGLSWDVAVTVVEAPSSKELEYLHKSVHRCSLVQMWTTELVSTLAPLLVTPPPIQSRVFQEISNGSLGYSQSEKLADIPFPFIFAQLLALQILFLAVVSPLTFTVLTGDSMLTPIVATVAVMSFWSLNELAKELENPFGEEANNIPIIDVHERFVEFLIEVHGTKIPWDRGFHMESKHGHMRESSALACNSDAMLDEDDGDTSS